MVHRNVRNGLICKYLENPNNFNLKLSLQNVVNILNNNIHYTTKYKPFDIFTSEDTNSFESVRKTH